MITVHGRWVKPDGTPAVGRIGLQLAPPGGTHHAGGWVQTTDPAQIVTTPVQWVDLVDGEMQMEVMASDDPSWHQSTRHYTLIVDIDGQPTTMGGVLLMSPGPVDLADVTPMPVDQGVMVVPVPGPANRLTVGDVTTVDHDQPCDAQIVGQPPDQQLHLTLARGAPGPANRLTVGDVTTVDHDQPCDAQIVGQPPDQQLHLTLARGAPGQLGPHAATHQPGGSDELPALLALGNRLPPGQADCTLRADGTQGAVQEIAPDGGGLVWTPQTAGTWGYIFWGGKNLSRGNLQLPPEGGALTFAARAAAPSTTTTTVYSYAQFYDAAGTALPAVPISSAQIVDWTWISGAIKIPFGAKTALLRLQCRDALPVRLSAVGWWAGAGGEWRPPGEPIPGLGTRITHPTPGGWYREDWINEQWIVVDGDTGKRAVGNGYCQRVANMVTWTATDVTPPTDWRPALGGVQPPAGCAYLGPAKWPSTYPGSPAR